jgi:hypothetical protein
MRLGGAEQAGSKLTTYLLFLPSRYRIVAFKGSSGAQL